MMECCAGDTCVGVGDGGDGVGDVYCGGVCAGGEGDGNSDTTCAHGMKDESVDDGGCECCDCVRERLGECSECGRERLGECCECGRERFGECCESESLVDCCEDGTLLFTAFRLNFPQQCCRHAVVVLAMRPHYPSSKLLQVHGNPTSL